VAGGFREAIERMGTVLEPYKRNREHLIQMHDKQLRAEGELAQAQAIGDAAAIGNAERMLTMRRKHTGRAQQAARALDVPPSMSG
jgi:hypothetical protein